MRPQFTQLYIFEWADALFHGPNYTVFAIFTYCSRMTGPPIARLFAGRLFAGSLFENPLSMLRYVRA
jgi:hypothetical protein